jgi:hypothetical protein
MKRHSTAVGKCHNASMKSQFDLIELKAKLQVTGDEAMSLVSMKQYPWIARTWATYLGLSTM